MIWGGAPAGNSGLGADAKSNRERRSLCAGGEDEVRLAGEVGAVETEAVAEAVGEGADAPLGDGALVTDKGHTLGAVPCAKSFQVASQIMQSPIESFSFRFP